MLSPSTTAHRTATDPASRLCISKVSKTYPNGIKALDALSMQVGNGMFGLLGPNGAGKSTLMRSLATLQHVDSGSMRFDGIDIQQQPQSLRRQIGYLPQSFGVYPGVSALQLLDYLAILKGVLDKSQRRRQIDQLLQRTNLYPHRRHAVSEFSGGMRQRFGIAQALLGAPQLLIVDEPTAGLDPEERSSFHQLLCGIAERMVVILSTHIVEDVRHLCPRLAVLAGGRLRFVGAPQALIERVRGQLWTRSIDVDAEPSPPAGSQLLSTRIIAGQRQLRVVAECQPGAEFVPAEADIEDGYFHALQGHANEPADAACPARQTVPGSDHA